MSSYLFGHLTDPNIISLHKHFDYFIDLHSDLHWDLQTNKLYVNCTEVSNITHGFIRYNVFEQQTAQQYANYYLICNYLRHNCCTYNQKYWGETPYKLHDLMIAKNLGLNIPYTEVTKQSNTSKETIVKPITGGAHTQINKEAAYSSIIQHRIHGKNKRLYIINTVPFCFEIVSDKIDYREDSATYVKLSDISSGIIKKVKKLMGKIQLNFVAVDFMVDKNNKYWFLEINTMPMFAAFDLKVNGLLSKTIHSELIEL
tara:strand:- start:12 stop:782 length:771 start_codon:yes stop_codon:yes gene_type:complete